MDKKEKVVEQMTNETDGGIGEGIEVDESLIELVEDGDVNEDND